VTRPPKAPCTCGKHRPYSRTRCDSHCPCRRCYENRHKDVYRTRGPASAHHCAECGEEAKNWSQVTGTDGTDPGQHYRPMCVKCHRAYDNWGQVMSEHKRRYWQTIPPEERNQSPATRAKNAKATRERWAAMTPEQRAGIGKKIRETWRRKAEASQQGELNV
jgi:hypothetical protein